MTQIDENLIRRITESVMAQLAAGQSSSVTPAEIHAPIGTCTGDYSQYPELKNRGSASLSVTTPSPANDNSTPDPVALLTGIITGRKLEAIKPGSVVQLASDAKLTPLANDVIRERKLTVERVGNDSATSASNAATSSNQWFYWIDGQCKFVDDVLGRLKSETETQLVHSTATSLNEAVQSLASRVKRDAVAGGILFVRSAALSACYANRCRSLRAVVGTCGEAVGEGIEELGANVLIVEYPHHGRKSMRAMIDQFTDTPRPNVPNVDRQLRELATCE